MTEAAMIDGLSRSRGPGRVDPADAALLAESPVSLRRVAGLFRPHAATLTVVFVIIAIASVVGLAQPFLVKEVIDVALPRRDVIVLLWCIGGMIAVAVVTAEDVDRALAVLTARHVPAWVLGEVAKNSAVAEAEEDQQAILHGDHPRF